MGLGDYPELCEVGSNDALARTGILISLVTMA
jgi:hypothetical protein